VARIQTPQHVQELQAQFKIREQFGLELLETVQPTFSLGDVKIASTGYPRKCMAESNVAATAGDNGECIITCPADIGIVLRVDEVWISDKAGSLNLRIDDNTALTDITTTFATKGFLDGRIRDQLPDAIIQSANPLQAAPNGRSIGLIENPAGVTDRYPVGIILGGGRYFLVRSNTVNTAFTCTWLWTEFLLEDR